MPERLKSKNQEVDPGRASLISQLMKVDYIKEELGNLKLTWISKPQALPQLDVAIIPRKRATTDFSYVNLFGQEHCLGISIVKDDEDLVKKYGEISRSLEDLHMGNGTKPEVVVLTESDVKDWINFYTGIKDKGIIEKVGKRDLAGFSGLERKTPDESTSLLRSFFEIVRIHHEHFDKHRVVKIEPKFDLDLAFLNDKGDLKNVPLYNIREYSYKNGLLVKRVSKEPFFVPGVVVQRPGEKEIEAVRRAITLQKRLSPSFEKKIDIPVLDQGQLSLFEKWGIEKSPKSHLENPKVDLRDLMDFLYLGKSSLNPGVLAQEPLGLSLPQINKEFGADVLFYKRDERNNKSLTSLNGVLGLNLRLLKRGVKDFSPIDNVGGLIIFPDDWTVDQMHAHAKAVTIGINRPNPGPDIYLLYVNSYLFAEWKKRGTIFETKPEGNQKQNINTNVFGFGPSLAGSVQVESIHRGPKIGDAQFLVRSIQGNNQTVNVMDFGSVYGKVPEGFKNIFGGPTTSSVLRHGFQTGELPYKTGIYSSIYELASIKEWPALFSDTKPRPEVSFMRAELIQRAHWADLVNVLGSRDRAKKLYELGAKDRQYWFGDKVITPGKVLLSHAHDDHVGQAALLEGDYIATWPTIGHLRAISNQKSSWWQKHDRFTHVEKGLIGGKYIKEDREMQPIYHQGEEVRLDSNVTAKFYFTDHSMSGSAIGIHTPNGNLFYSGDIKPGPITDAAIELASKQDYQTFLWENTNPKNSSKPSALTNEEFVTKNFEKVFNDPKNKERLIIVMSPPNGLEKIDVLYDLAERAGRNVVLSYQHADIINHLRDERNRAPLDAAARSSIFLPEIGEDMGIYSKPIKARPWQSSIDDIAEDKSIGVFEQKHLEKSASKTVLVVSPYDDLMKIVGGAVLTGPVFIYSSPYLYDRRSRVHYAANQFFLKQTAAKIYADFEVFGLNGGAVEVNGGPQNSYHWSGHATFEENMNLILNAIGPNPKDKKVYFVHGESPERYARDATEWFKRKKITGVEFIGQLKLYDHNDPVRKPGHIIKLGQ